MTENIKKRKSRVVIPLSGEVLKAVMELRAIYEQEMGEPTSLTSVVKAAVLAKLEREKAERRAEGI